jgi:hypothetical protein
MIAMEGVGGSMGKHVTSLIIAEDARLRVGRSLFAVTWHVVGVQALIKAESTASFFVYIHPFDLKVDHLGQGEERCSRPWECSVEI